MKKLSLDVEMLQVESFATDDEKGEIGTVNAHAGTGDGCSVFYSCEASVCGSSCDGGCDSGAATCGHYTPCNGDSVEFCWSDYCP